MVRIEPLAWYPQLRPIDDNYSLRPGLAGLGWHQCGIRSGARFNKNRSNAQGWQALEVSSREHLAAERSVTVQRPGAEHTRCTLASMRRVSEANEVQAEPDRVMAADARSGAAVTLIASAGAPRRSRSLEERLIMRVPSSYRVGAALTLRLFRPDAWVRRRFVRHAVMSGWAAVQRLAGRGDSPHRSYPCG